MWESTVYFMIRDLKEITASVDFFIYKVSDDSISISTETKRLLGIDYNERCYLSMFKSLIVGVDIPVFVHKFGKWLKGDVSDIIQVRIIDAKNQMRSIQIKGHVRYDANQNIVSVYGAFFDVSYLSN